MDTPVWWKTCKGETLEPALRSGAVALLDTRWVIEYANRARKGGRWEPMKSRSDLPPDAFLSFDEMLAGSASSSTNTIPIIALSYMWLDRDHPDPRGDTLRVVARGLKIFFQTSILARKQRWGLFWDYASLFQKPRDSVQEDLFQDGLSGMSLLYSHNNTTVFTVCEFPNDLSCGPSLGKDSNGFMEYAKRGWPFTEVHLASLSPAKQIWDLTKLVNKKYPISVSQLSNQPVPPLTPSDFEGAIRDCSFTNRKVDLPLVVKLYHQCFCQAYVDANCHCLYYSDCGWGDTEVVSLMQGVVKQDHLQQLTRLSLRKNLFGVQGCQALKTAYVSSKLPSLSFLDLSQNELIGDKGTEILAEVFVGVKTVQLCEIGLTSKGCSALANAIQCYPNKLALAVIDLSKNELGNLGVQILANALIRLKKVNLYSVGMDGESCIALEGAVAQGNCIIKSINLIGNKIAENGYIALGRAVCLGRWAPTDIHIGNENKEAFSNLHCICSDHGVELTANYCSYS